MLGVFSAHLGLATRAGVPAVAQWLHVAGMYASPLFVGTSGAMLGFLLSTLQGERREQLRVRLIDRGLFLLLVAHLALSLAHYLTYRDPRRAITEVHITDAIGASIIVGAAFAYRLPARIRLAAAAGAYLGGLALAFAWQPSGAWLEFAKSAIAGGIGVGETARASFPLLGWLAVYLVGTVAGERLHVAHRTGTLGRTGRALLLWGGAAMLAAACLKVGFYSVITPPDAGIAGFDLGERILFHLTSPFGKYPPAPAYLLGFGGAALLVLGACLTLEGAGRLSPALRWAAVFGQASLAVYIAQQYLIVVLVRRLGIDSTPALVGVGVAVVAVLWAFARFWREHVGNQVFTVGLHARWASRRASR